MAGSNHGNTSSSSSHGGTGNHTHSTTTTATGGRERAIEALIDREPYGDYYRAIRILDEAVPMAQSSRPNLVTKAALIDQAFQLSYYDIDTLYKYDTQYLSSSSTEEDVSSSSTLPPTSMKPDTVLKIDALQRERIMHYQMKVMAYKMSLFHPSNSSSSQGTTSLSHHTDGIMSSPITLVSDGDIGTTTTTTTKSATVINTQPPPSPVKSLSRSTSSNSTVAFPPSKLIASIRHVFDHSSSSSSHDNSCTNDTKDLISTTTSSSSSQLMIDTTVNNTTTTMTTTDIVFELRTLLQAISTHPMFMNTTTTIGSSSSTTIVGTNIVDTTTPTKVSTTTSSTTTSITDEQPLPPMSSKSTNVISSTSASLNMYEQQLSILNIEKMMMNLIKQITNSAMTNKRYTTSGTNVDQRHTDRQDHNNSTSSSDRMELIMMDDTILQGLLISILSLLTCTDGVNNLHHPDSSSKVSSSQIRSNNSHTNFESSLSDDMDVPFQSTLQVGPLLALIPLLESPALVSSTGGSTHIDDTKNSEELSNNNNNNNNNNNRTTTTGTTATSIQQLPNHVVLESTTQDIYDPTLLQYYANAAAIYEERYEIVKARTLAKLSSTPSPITTTTTTEHPSVSSQIQSSISALSKQLLSSLPSRTGTTESDVETNNNTTTQPSIDTTTSTTTAAPLETPTAGDHHHHPPDMEFSIRTEDDDDDDNLGIGNNIRETMTTSHRPSVADDGGTTTISDREDHQTNTSTAQDDGINHQQGSVDESDSDDDDNNNDNIVGTNNNDDDDIQNDQQRLHNNRYERAGDILDDIVRNYNDDDDVLQPNDDENHENHARESSSSGSGSSDDDDDDDEDDDDEGMGESDDGEALDTDDDEDEEEAVLRQAMAMSMVEQQQDRDVDAAATLVARALESLMSIQQPSSETAPIATQNTGAQSEDGDDTNSVRTVRSPLSVNPSSMESPVTKRSENDSVHHDMDVEDDESNLPPFPEPPSHRILTGSNANTTVGNSTTPSISQLDPTKLSDFGSISTSNVLFHLLYYTANLVEQRLSIQKTDASERIPVTMMVRGGVGSSLSVDPNIRQSNDHSSTIQHEPLIDKKFDVTVQLLIASIVVLFEHRNDAIANLRKAVLREQQMARDGTVDCDQQSSDINDHDDDDSSNAILSTSVEEDDPALTLAMNYVEDDVPLSSDSLENKGMLRKAAAAAHDTNTMIKSLRKRTNCWKHEVNLISDCLFCSLKIFRQYLQSMVRQSFIHDKSSSSNLMGWSILNCYTCVPQSVLIKLTHVLDSLTSIATQSSLLALLGGEVLETERVFHSLHMYKEAISVWGECIPMFYSSDTSRVDILRSLITGCSGFASPLKHLSSLQTILAFPTSDVETQYFKLNILSRRLRVRDFLDGFVSRPMHYLSNGAADSGDDDGYLSRLISDKFSNEPRVASSIVSTLGNSLESLVGDRSEVKCLFLALCHRCQAHSLLLDGFYAVTETESDDRPSPLVTSKTLSSGDIVRVSSNPSPSLQFDLTKCSDSIAVYSGAVDDTRLTNSGTCSVHQRASKVWGTVLSTQQYSPKTGIHRWAVRLDKCERGHVFIGVASSQATIKTYVGGDKYGWGMIGTQALWHDRRKIRGDYGSTFRTGSIIVVTLDSDAGTLSFSSWKDNSVSSSISVDPLVQNIISPKKVGFTGGTVDDWGVAFEGLPLDAKLYPAIGLYQRDDRVTLLTVESPGVSGALIGSTDTSGGACFYPSVFEGKNDIPDYASRVRHHNNILTWDGISYAASVLSHVVNAIRNNDLNDFILSNVLPGLAASLCLLPRTVPILSTRCALFLMPSLSTCILELERRITEDDQQSQSLFSEGMLAGHWQIRSTSPSELNSEFQEYILDVTVERNDNGLFFMSGQSSHPKNRKIFGCVNGSSLNFVENCQVFSPGDVSKEVNEQESDCSVITARLSLDGRRFEGTCRKIPSEIILPIAGQLVHSFPGRQVEPKIKASISSCAAILCLAQGHLAAMLGDDVSTNGNSQEQLTPEDVRLKREALRNSLARPTLSRATIYRTENDFTALLKRFCPPKEVEDAGSSQFTSILLKANESLGDMSKNIFDSDTGQTRILNFVSSVDDFLCSESGGKGSLSRLCPEIYSKARQKIICSVLYHSGFDVATSNIAPSSWTSGLRSNLRNIWRCSLKILEDGVRNAILSLGTGSVSSTMKCGEVCKTFCHTADFLLHLIVEEMGDFDSKTHEVVNDFSIIYQLVDCTSDLNYLESQMVLASHRGFLRLISLSEIRQLIDVIDVKCPTLIECLLVSLPKQLGRGKGKFPAAMGTGSDENGIEEQTTLLNGSFLFDLSGADLKVVSAIRKLISEIFESIGRVSEFFILQQIHTNRAGYVSSVDSLVLTSLTVFICNMKRDDFIPIIVSSRLLSFLPKVMEAHRYSIKQGVDIRNIDLVESSHSILSQICQRDVSRAILRCAVAVVHVVTYQATVNLSNISDFVTYDSCIGILSNELDVVCPVVRHDVLLSLSSLTTKRSNDDWKGWQLHFLKDESGKNMNAMPATTGSARGLSYLNVQGSLLTSFSHGIQLKSTSASKIHHGGSSKHTSDIQSSTVSIFSHTFLSHWLHILCVVFRSDEAVSRVLKNDKCISVLFNIIGLTVQLDTDHIITEVKQTIVNNIMIPGRFRARMLRLMLPLISASEETDVLIRALFHLAGHSSAVVSQGDDNEEWIVSREAISLLRHLHAPHHKAWRRCVNSVILKSIQSESNDEYLVYVKIGVLSFFSGCPEGINRGSYVLLKPSMSSVLTLENQSLPSGKLHGIGGTSMPAPSMGSTPHHLIGNGTSSVIAGLCGTQASAGIVSNIDLRNGSCEIILVARGQNESNEKGSAGDSKQPRSTSSDKSALGGRHTLTVRAVRTALVDVIHAQEVPLYIDSSMSLETLVESVVQTSITRLISVFTQNRDTNTDTVCLTTDLMMLRCCITLLSDERILHSLISLDKRNGALSALLTLAWPDAPLKEKEGRNVKEILTKNIPQLVIHEARFHHLLSLIRDIKLRVNAMKTTTEDEWKKRFDTFRLIVTTKVDSSLGKVVETEKVLQPVSVAQDNITSPNTISRDDDVNTGRSLSQSTAAGNDDDDEDDSEAATTAAAHLREAAIAQMSELGLPRSWSDFALRRTGGVNIEAAVTFCLERGPEIERMIAEEQERDRNARDFSGGSSSRRRGSPSSRLLRQLLEMGFPKRWCTEALTVTGNNVDEALTWILSNGERLSEEDEAIEANAENEATNEDDEQSLDDEDEDDTEADDLQISGSVTASDALIVANDSSDDKGKMSCVPSWSGSVTPLRFISGRAIVDPARMEVSGLPNGGFSSVGTKGVLLCEGMWYYEAVLETAGCLQIGWADGSFAGHCHADRGDGCGDGPSSWAFDGWRRYRWHATATEWGCRWKEGDVVGCLVDMDQHVVSFTLNGQGESIGMGIAFKEEGFRPCGGVYACVSFNRKEKLRLILGGQGSEPFKYQPPSGYRGVGEAILAAVDERKCLLAKEVVLNTNCTDTNTNCTDTQKDEHSGRFLCDFSDSDHGHELSAWAHRYYGSDASVHLGSGRAKQVSTKSLTGSTFSDLRHSSFLTRRLQQTWAQMSSSRNDVTEMSSYNDLSDLIFDSYKSVQSGIVLELVDESMGIAVLLARKLLLHVLITLGNKFNLSYFVKDEACPMDVALRFWNVVEACTSLRQAGWVGEAGTMAIAAEALGLCISSNDQLQQRPSGERRGVIMASDLDENLFLPTCGYTQVLTSVLLSNGSESLVDTSHYKPATAEAAMGSDGGSGILAFLQEGLQSVVCKSPELRRVIVAKIRQSVRHLAVVEYDGDDCDSSNHKEIDGEEDPNVCADDVAKTQSRDEEIAICMDARLIAFLSGLLLSKPVQSIDNFEVVQRELFEAWSVGLLSASLPWRMICAFTVSGLLNQNPGLLSGSFKDTPTLARYFGRLQSTVARRLWAERAAFPVCSRYSQSLVELLASVHRAVQISKNLPSDFLRFWGAIQVDAATPLPINNSSTTSCDESWEYDENWISSDSGWDVWTGSVTLCPVDWKTPTRSNVRTLMDGGDGPPFLREGCYVMRGLNWDQKDETKINADGKDIYDAEKANRELEKQLLQEKMQPVDDTKEPVETDVSDMDNNGRDNITLDPAEENETESTIFEAPIEANSLLAQKETDALNAETKSDHTNRQEKNPKKLPSPQLPIGSVLSIEPWGGIPGLGRRVRWHLTGIEGVYRFGGDGGMYDVCHVDVNSKETKIKKRHPLPESSEQCAARHGFGAKAKHNIVLRIRKTGVKVMDDNNVSYQHRGILEWPDFGAGVRVDCTRHLDGTMMIEEKQLLFGSKDSGWYSRFGQASFVSGSCFILSKENKDTIDGQPEIDILNPTSSLYEALYGRCQFDVDILRNPENGRKLMVLSEMKLHRGITSNDCHSCDLPRSLSPMPPPLTFDRDYCASTLALSRDCRTISCFASDGGRGTVFASIGFTKGVHYWEVKLEQADIGSVFIGVAEKPIGSGSGSSYLFDASPRLNRWLGWGFVNFRATYTAGAERVFGSHCHAGDTVGVLLDCDSGRISFFFDGLKYGEHIMNDLGCAFENLSPFGFNVDGCGSGGTGQGAPSGFENGSSSRFPAQGTVRPRTLWPVIGLRNHGDRVTLSPKWSTSFGSDGSSSLNNILKVDEVLDIYSAMNITPSPTTNPEFPLWFMNEAYFEYRRWYCDSWTRSTTRGSGPNRDTCICLDVDFDSSPIACAAASASLGLSEALLAGDRVKLTRSAGRILQLSEEALVIGVYQGRLYYKIVSQKSEGGSLTEGGGRAWCWDESEVVDGLPFLTPRKGRGVPLPKLSRFTCQSRGGLRVIYENGAVLRSDLEIIDGSETLGTIPVGTIIPVNKVLDRRVNSCGGIRFRVQTEKYGEGWISARIRGASEEPIVESVTGTDSPETEDRSNIFDSPLDCANAWYLAWKEQCTDDESQAASFQITSVEQFFTLASKANISGLSVVEFDSILTMVMNAISNYSSTGDTIEMPFREVATAISYACAMANTNEKFVWLNGSQNMAANQAAASVLAKYPNLPSVHSILSRIAILRLFNRRARLALPWLSMRPCQEGSAILGGLSGHGTSPDRAGRSHDIEPNYWVLVPSIATRVRTLRGLFFTSIKRDFLQSILQTTTTPTLLSHDEYELPREIRTVRINRLKAARAMLGDDRSAKRKYSVFSQILNETKNWGGASLRRGFVAKGHGGQKRAFKVKLIGEGVNDYSGPYREAFTDAMADVLKVEPDNRCSLGVLDPTPNNASSIGEHRELFMFSLNGKQLLPSSNVSTYPAEDRIRRSFSSLMVATDESSREVEESLIFFGRLVGTAFRHGIPLDLPLPLASVWKALTEQPSLSSEKLFELDHLAHKQLESEKDADMAPLVLWQQRMVNAFMEGLGNVLPVEILPLLSGEELRETMCGNPDVDVELLKQVVEYEGYSPSDDVIRYFWTTLNEMTNDERKQFLQFVWARNRLPMRESDFDAPFKIQKDTCKSEQALPSASTCFFTLTLPEYTNQETLREKLLFAIRNVTTMETDFQTNSAEIAEGYRSF